MECLLVAINAKYIHSNPGVMCLKAYYDSQPGNVVVSVAEYTINQQPDFILSDIYRRRPDIIGFSCYIWNISYVVQLADSIRKVMPQVKIIAGGPEVSYRASTFLEDYKAINLVICGEGEKTFARLMNAYENNEIPENVSGICYRNDGKVVSNPAADVMNLSDIPFIYGELEEYENRIIYYESSRGCPFSCSYCLSSIDKQLRFRDMELVKQELQFFLEHKVPQVKFVDRTFNCKKSHAMDIWRYILEHDNGVTNFHFEIAADLIDDEELELLSQMRPGLVQFEIGIQSTNSDTIKEINRSMKLDRVISVISRIKSFENIHQHVDLIAGLPYEDMESFIRSFNQVYELKCQQLQLGFLKVLSGSKMYDNADKYGIVYTAVPPYEVLSTKWLSYDDIMELKLVEEMVEEYYNSGQFVHAISFMESFFDTPYELYRSLGRFYGSKFVKGEKHSRIARYELLMEFAAEYGIGQLEELGEWMLYDIYERENSGKRPGFARDLGMYKDKLKDLYHIYKPTGTNVHIEVFEKIFGDKETYVVFDYSNHNIEVCR